jgi:integrase
VPRRPNPVPSYRLHKPSGQAVCTVRLADGTRRDLYLGPYNSPESKQEYERVIAEQRATAAGSDPASPLPTAYDGRDVTVNEVLVAYLKHADAYYRHPDGTPTQEAQCMRDAVRLLKHLYGHTPAREFGPLAMKAVRQAMVDADLCRTVVNARVNRVRRVFKWAASEELIPFAAYQSLTTVQGLRRGRSAAREPEPVKPVAVEVVAATLPHLPRPVAAMVELQRLTGMRPGEVIRMRGADIDRTGPVWVYRPAGHKTAWRGKARAVPLGPRARAVLRPFLDGREPSRFFFSPLEAREERYARMRSERKTRVQPSQECRRKKAPLKLPGERYRTGSYAQAVKRGIERANAARVEVAAEEGREPELLPHWHPNQLRHTHATEVRRKYGLEAAGAALGHERLSVTEVYAEKNEELARRVATEMG